MPTYVRYHVSYCSPVTGQPVGLFVAVWHLVERKTLTEAEVKEYWEMRQRSEQILPIPPFYADGNPQGAVTWFKDTPAVRRLLANFDFYFRVLET